MDKQASRSFNAVCCCIWMLGNGWEKSRDNAPPGGLHLLNTRMQAVLGSPQRPLRK
jgi:hypothetical protein